MIRKTEMTAILRMLGQASTSTLYKKFLETGAVASLVTLRRELRKMLSGGLLATRGTGRSTVYLLTEYGKLTDDVDVQKYCTMDPDVRYGAQPYNFDLFSAIIFDLFSSAQRKTLTEATAWYQTKIKDITHTLHEKELERFVIELSWKSSKIEGNTYTLLDTEKLLLEAKEAPGHSHREAQMILNHKSAFEYIRAHSEIFHTLTRAQIEDVHKLIVEKLGVTNNLRKKPVGITGSRYRPLDNEYQISEALEALTAATNRMSDGYGKALVILFGISYIQPFEDGNKRTARLMTNAVLLAHDLAPLSYRSVSEEAYREATLVFYELNSFIPFRDIFVAQYDFAARNYLVGKG